MLARSFLIESSSKLLVTRTGIKAWSSLILGRIRPLILELLVLEWWKFLAGQSWSNFMCSIIGVWERLHNVLGQIGSKLWCHFCSNHRQGRDKSLVGFDFRPNQTTHFGVTYPWVTKISHFWIWISLKPVGKSWSNFMCSIIGVGERLHKVLGQIDLGTLDSGERSLPFGLLV